MGEAAKTGWLLAELQSASDEIDGRKSSPVAVRLPLTYTQDADGFNVADLTSDWFIVIDPTMEKRGEVRYAAYGPGHIIALREWDERVFLHEVLHVLVGRVLPDDGNDNHALIALLEVGIIAAGFRYEDRSDG